MKNNFTQFGQSIIAIAMSLPALFVGCFQLQAQSDYFNTLKNQRVVSDATVEWRQFGPGMSGYNEEFWCHPTDPNVMFVGPDMHVAYGTWDNGKTWQTIKDSDGDGLDLERVNDMTFSLNNPNFGVAIERRGKVFTTQDKGRSWQLKYTIPHAASSPYYNAHSRIAIHPDNDNIWFIGAGGFWNVKENHKSKSNPQGIKGQAAAYGYVLKTTDGGSSWSKVADNISPDLDVARIIINPKSPNQISMATGQGMFRSTDGGNTWASSATGLPNNLPRDITYYYNKQTGEFVIYLVEQTVYTPSGNTTQSKGGVYKSTDAGKTWTDITGNLGLDLKTVTDFTARDGYNKSVAYWLGMTKASFKSTYNQYPDQVLSVFNRIVVNPNNKNQLYLCHNKKHDMGFGPGELFKSDDGGETWVACARNGKYWIDNPNATYWQGKNNPTGTNMEFAHLQVYMDNNRETSGNRHLAINTRGEVFIGVDQQTFRSTDAGSSWKQIDDYETAPASNKWVGRGNSDLPGRFMLLETGKPGRKLLCSGEHGLWQTTDLSNYPDKTAVAVEQIEGQVHDHSGNSGAHSISTVAVHPNDPDIIYVLSWRQEHRGKLRRTTDGGKTWENISTIFEASNAEHEGLATQYSLQIDPVNPQNMYFCSIRKPISEVGGSIDESSLTKGGYGVYRSIDGGYTWDLKNSGLPEGCSVRRIILDPDNPNTLYAALNKWKKSDPWGLYKSTNKGNTWVKMSVPSAIQSINNVFIDRNTKHIFISCGERTGQHSEGGVYRSKDNGASWQQIFWAPYVWQCETSPANANMIVVTVAGQAGSFSDNFKNPGIYISKDDGATWSKINKGLGQPDKMVDVKPDPEDQNVLWAAAWGSGWYKATIPSQATGSIQINSLPSTLTEGATGFDVTVNYEASSEQEIVVFLTSPTGSWLGNVKKTVSAGRGSETLTLAATSALMVGDGYSIKADIRPIGGDANSRLDRDESTLNVVAMVVDDIEFEYVPSVIDRANTFDVNVRYTAASDRDLVVIINSPTGTWLGNGRVTVGAGTANQVITVTMADIPPAENGYLLKADIRPVGGDGASRYDRDETTIDITTPSIQSPYGGTAWVLPGRIEAEDYDEGGEGVAFHDSDAVSNGGAYRSEGVDIQPSTDVNGDYNIGWMAQGEWLEYSVNVTTTQAYDFYFRVASPNGNGQFRVLIDGVEVIAATYVPNTGAWQTYQTIYERGVSVTAGQHIVRIEILAGGMNFNFWAAWKNNSARISDYDDLQSSDANILVYPNPAKGLVNVDLTSSTEGSFMVNLLDVNGRLVKQLTADNSVAIDLSDVSPGVYFLVVGLGDSTITKKLFVH